MTNFWISVVRLAGRFWTREIWNAKAAYEKYPGNFRWHKCKTPKDGERIQPTDYFYCKSLFHGLSQILIMWAQNLQNCGCFVVNLKFLQYKDVHDQLQTLVLYWSPFCQCFRCYNTTVVVECQGINLSSWNLNLSISNIQHMCLQ